MVTSTRHRGHTYGLVIDASQPLPGMVPGAIDAAPDVRVDLDQAAWDGWLPRMGGATPWYETAGRDDGRPWLTVWRDAAFRFEYAEGAVFTVNDDGSRVEGSWAAPLTLADAVSYLLGPVLAFVLRLRGAVPMHASGTVIDGRGVLFVGPAGAGKSSTAAAFAARGYPVLSDDVVPLRLIGRSLRAGPGHPRISLWSDSAMALWERGESLPAVSDVYDKRVLDLLDRGAPFAAHAVDVAAIFLLGERVPGPDVVHRPVARRDGFLSLAANTYGAHLLDAELRATEFALLSQVAAGVPTRALSMPDDLRCLARACDALARSVTGD
jgi:hypothetical protein